MPDRDHDRLLHGIARVLKPGAALFATFRSQWAYVTQAVKMGDFATAGRAVSDRSGRMFGTATR